MNRFSSWMVFTVVMASIWLGHSLDAADSVRIGILGFDNYQAVEHVAFFNNPKSDGELANLRVVAACPAISTDYPDSAANTERWKGQILNLYKDQPGKHPVEFVTSTDELLQRCDAVMIWSLDGRQHLAQATAVIMAGKPLFIGRPLASTTADAVAILRLAEKQGVPCWSCSQHRYSPGFIGMRNHPEVGQVLGCDVYGAFDQKAPPSDQFTRPLHSLETMYTIMGPGCISVSCTSTETAESITAIWKDGRVATYRGIKSGAVKYSATVFGDKGVSTAGIYGHGVPVKGVVPTDDKYMGYASLSIQLAEFFQSKKLPVSHAETLELFAILEAATESRSQNGTTVSLRNLRESVGK